MEWYIEIVNYLKEMHALSTFLKLSLALFCGGILGMERGKKNRPAGLRTYMLVCVGATLVMLTNQFIYEQYGNVGDPARLGAQVISGIGFLGAGTIIVTGRNRVKGLTTAAGLWADACIGIAIGSGFYLGAMIGCSLIFFVMSILYRFDTRMTANTKSLDLYLEFNQMSDLGNFISYIKEHDMKILDLEMAKSNTVGDVGIAVLLTLKMEKKKAHAEIIQMLSLAKGVMYIEEL